MGHTLPLINHRYPSYLHDIDTFGFSLLVSLHNFTLRTIQYPVTVSKGEFTFLSLGSLSSLAWFLLALILAFRSGSSFRALR